MEMKNNELYPAGFRQFDVGNKINGHFYWVGHCSNGITYSVGQTFNVKKRGKLRNIKLYSEMVTGKTEVYLTLFEFNEQQHLWDKPMAETHVQVDHSNNAQWLEFDMKGILLDASQQYGFKINCNNGGMIAVGEGDWKEKDPYPDGEEWTGSSENMPGVFYRNHDLTFLASVECANE
jgi:hypothetical protein